MNQAEGARLAGITMDEYMLRMEEFHGHASPGVLMGGYMVDAAWSILGDTPYLNAAVETVVCLPDAVQMLTPCTLGNGVLQLLDWGKFALTLYDRQTLKGVRASLDVARIEDYPLVANWYLRRPENHDVEKAQVVETILAGAHDLVQTQPVRMLASLKNEEKVPTQMCPQCGEHHPQRQGGLCPSCNGGAYYRA